MSEREARLIIDKSEISKIIEEKIKGKKIIFTQWYKMGILKKGLSEELFSEIFPQFDKVNAIELETLAQGNLGYELFYTISNNTTISIGTIPKEDSLIIIHLIEYKRSLEHRFKKFKR